MVTLVIYSLFGKGFPFFRFSYSKGNEKENNTYRSLRSLITNFQEDNESLFEKQKKFWQKELLTMKDKQLKILLQKLDEQNATHELEKIEI